MPKGGATNEYGLTQKQENFCLKFIECGNASEAYRHAYDWENSKPEYIPRRAKEVLDNRNVSARLEQLRESIMKEHKITVDTLLEELEEARTCALTCETPQSSAAVTATMGKAKLLGLDKQIIDHQSTDGTMTPKATVVAKDVQDVLDKL